MLIAWDGRIPAKVVAKPASAQVNHMAALEPLHWDDWRPSALPAAPLRSRPAAFGQVQPRRHGSLNGRGGWTSAGPLPGDNARRQTSLARPRTERDPRAPGRPPLHRRCSRLCAILREASRHAIGRALARGSAPLFPEVSASSRRRAQSLRRTPCRAGSLKCTQFLKATARDARHPDGASS